MSHPYRTPVARPRCRRCRADTAFGSATVLSIMAAIAALLLSDNGLLRAFALGWMLHVAVCDGVPLLDWIETRFVHTKHVCEEEE